MPSTHVSTIHRQRVSTWLARTTTTIALAALALLPGCERLVGPEPKADRAGPTFVQNHSQTSGPTLLPTTGPGIVLGEPAALGLAVGPAPRFVEYARVGAPYVFSHDIGLTADRISGRRTMIAANSVTAALSILWDN